MNDASLHELLTFTGISIAHHNVNVMQSSTDLAIGCIHGLSNNAINKRNLFVSLKNHNDWQEKLCTWQQENVHARKERERLQGKAPMVIC